MTSSSKTPNKKDSAATSMSRGASVLLMLGAFAVVVLVGRMVINSQTSQPRRMPPEANYSAPVASTKEASVVPEELSAWLAEFDSAAGSIEIVPETNDLLAALSRVAPEEFLAWVEAKVALPPAEFAALQITTAALSNAAPEVWERWEDAAAAWNAAPNAENESKLIGVLLDLEYTAPALLDAYVAADAKLAEGWPKELAAYIAATQELKKVAPQQVAALEAAEARAMYGKVGE